MGFLIFILFPRGKLWVLGAESLRMPERILYLLQNKNLKDTRFVEQNLYLHLTSCPVKKKIFKKIEELSEYESLSMQVLCTSCAQNLSLVLDIKKIVLKCVYYNTKLEVINVN